MRNQEILNLTARRIEKKDLVDSNNTHRYYYSKDWQILADYNDGGTLKNSYLYGNYIDEVLKMTHDGNDYYYLQDHLYSPVALCDNTGSVVERYEYDAYGKVTIWNAGLTTKRDSSDYDNIYYFTGREFDYLDNGGLKLYYYRNRYYDADTGRFLQHDPLGITPNPEKPNRFGIRWQYLDGLNLYEYVSSNPLVKSDPMGLVPLHDVDWFDLSPSQQRSYLGSRIMDLYISRALGYYRYQRTFLLNDDLDEMINLGGMRDVHLLNVYKQACRANREIADNNWVTVPVLNSYVSNVTWRVYGNFPNLGWWLGIGTATGVGTIEIKTCGNLCTIRNRRVNYIWHDEINGRDLNELTPLERERVNIWHHIEHIVGHHIMDEFLIANYYVHIFWKDFEAGELKVSMRGN